ncbi:restriction endonuclease [Adlercreutzia caecimuris]|jgi:restriction system protein|uniref:restriction endonuclease n=1 Tax=Adlercreutzia caecimuris TaxID=671266 RepID=UPI001A9B9D8D|nr:restriction endonuclease [Adlercreutzia caecimuris]
MSAWIIRAGKGGVRAPEWINGGYIAIYWNLDGADISALSKDDIKALYRTQFPDASRQVVAASAGMIFRFATEITKGSTVVMYDPATRLYHIGKVSGPCAFVPPKDSDDDNGSYRRAVNWEFTAPRDALSARAKHSLGSISTLFAVSADTLRELEKASNGTPSAAEEEQEEENSSEVREATAEDGIERIKDRVLQLSWDDMEYLVAGVLRSMGYKTSMTSRGSDGGRDIIASPDGLGLESPRIVVEVKHRKEAMSAPTLRSFIGGLRNTDSGLYVSTGGFTKEAAYEADRALMPIKLLNLDQLVRLIVDNYDNADMDTRAILPLVRIYWPA